MAGALDFSHFLGFTRKPLKSGALRNRLMALDPEAFGDALSAWMEALTPSWPPTDTLPATALDGQALRGTGTIDERPQLLIAAYEHPTGAVLKPLAVPPETHEQKAALGLLKPWVLTGRVITAGRGIVNRKRAGSSPLPAVIT